MFKPLCLWGWSFADLCRLKATVGTMWSIDVLSTYHVQITIQSNSLLPTTKQFHVNYAKSRKLNTVLNIYILFFLTLILPIFSECLHKMRKCAVILQNAMQMYERFLK